MAEMHSPIRQKILSDPVTLLRMELEMQVGIGEDSRPSFMDEYLSVAGNAGGALDDYWEAIYRHPRLMEAIWDFCKSGTDRTDKARTTFRPSMLPCPSDGKCPLSEGGKEHGAGLERSRPMGRGLSCRQCGVEQ